METYRDTEMGIAAEMKWEINQRRREDGFVQDVPPHVWEIPAVRIPLKAAIEYAQADGAYFLFMDFTSDNILADLLDEVYRAINTQSIFKPEAVLPEENFYSNLLVVCRSCNSQIAQRIADINFPMAGPDEIDMEKEKEGGNAAAEFLAWHMNQDELVQAFRRDVVGDVKPTKEEAWEFLTSPLPTVLSVNDYTEMGLVPLTTKGRIVGDISGAEYDHFGFVRGGNSSLMPASPTIPFIVEAETQSGGIYRKTVTHRRDKYVCASLDLLAPLLHNSVRVYTGLPRERDLPAPVPFFEERDNEARFVRGMEGTVISEALNVAALLASCYPVDFWDALQFLLTGKITDLDPLLWHEYPYTPFKVIQPDSGVPAVEAVFRAHGSVQLYVQPWVGPEILANFWRTRQRAVNGRHPTVPLKHNLDVFRFVLRHTVPGEPFQWQKLCRIWEKEQGQVITRNAMQMIFKRVQDALFPGYTRTESKTLKAR